jgi:predicted Ser/Thr protein kinase
MGLVYLYEDTELHRSVAVKVISETERDANHRERFEREARAMASIAHPNVVHIYSFGRSGGHPYIIMEFVEGEALDDRIRRTGHLPVEEALRLVRQVAEGLREAWRHGIVHRDIKPSNILIDSRGEAKVADFGLAKPVGPVGRQSSTLTEMCQVMGTPHYLSPEQAIGDAVDFRSDIFSLGAVLFEMLTGSPPYEASHKIALVLKPANEPFPDLRSRRPDAPESVSTLLSRMTQRDKDQRPSSYEELLADIDAAAKPGDTVSVSTGAAASNGAFRRWWPSVAAGALIGVLLVASVAVYFARRFFPSSRASVARSSGGAASPASVALPRAVESAGTTSQSDEDATVARLSFLDGSASLASSAQPNDWQALILNASIAGGDRIYCAPAARAELEVHGGDVVWLSGEVELSADQMTRQIRRFALPLGKASLSVQSNPAETEPDPAVVETPNVAITIEGPAKCRVDVASNGDTEIVVRQGSAQAQVNSQSVTVKSGQSLSVSGVSNPTYRLGSAPSADNWDVWTEQRLLRRTRSSSYQHMSAEIPGGADLDTAGHWEDVPSYGEAWTPTAAPAGWQPYKDGRWIWRASWGWTWMPDEPWAWATSHYGRWEFTASRWYWIPKFRGVLVRYAPAVVNFVELGTGPADRYVGWYPLGAGEPIQPWWGRPPPSVFSSIPAANRNRVIIVSRGAFEDGAATGRQLVTRPDIVRLAENTRSVAGPLKAAPARQAFRLSSASAVRPSEQIVSRSVVRARIVSVSREPGPQQKVGSSIAQRNAPARAAVRPFAPPPARPAHKPAAAPAAQAASSPPPRSQQARPDSSPEQPLSRGIVLSGESKPVEAGGQSPASSDSPRTAREHNWRPFPTASSDSSGAPRTSSRVTPHAAAPRSPLDWLFSSPTPGQSNLPFSPNRSEPSRPAPSSDSPRTTRERNPRPFPTASSDSGAPGISSRVTPRAAAPMSRRESSGQSNPPFSSNRSEQSQPTSSVTHPAMAAPSYQSAPRRPSPPPAASPRPAAQRAAPAGHATKKTPTQ